MEEIFREVDTDGSGEVDLEEFTVAMAQIMNAV
jgi:Ca2+-binding EF-hand superfamily protein